MLRIPTLLVFVSLAACGEKPARPAQGSSARAPTSNGPTLKGPASTETETIDPDTVARGNARPGQPLTDADVERFLAAYPDWRDASKGGPAAVKRALAKHGYDALSWGETRGRITALAALMGRPGVEVPPRLTADAEVLRPRLAEIQAALK